MTECFNKERIAIWGTITAVGGTIISFMLMGIAIAAATIFNISPLLSSSVIIIAIIVMLIGAYLYITAKVSTI